MASYCLSRDRAMYPLWSSLRRCTVGPTEARTNSKQVSMHLGRDSLHTGTEQREHPRSSSTLRQGPFVSLQSWYVGLVARRQTASGQMKSASCAPQPSGNPEILGL